MKAGATNPDGKRVTYTYEPVRGRRATMVDSDSGVFTYSHDANGQLIQLQ